MIKVKFVFENDSNEYTLPLKTSTDISIKDQISEFLKTLNIEMLNSLDDEKKNNYLLFNSNTDEFMLSIPKINDIYKKTTFTMKNCTKFAQDCILSIENANKESSPNNSTRESIAENITNSSTKGIDKKKLAYKLNDHFKADLFTEEFIVYGGIKPLVEFIQNSTGNVRSYGTNAFKTLMEYMNAIEYVLENYDVFANFYNLLVEGNGNNIKAINHLLSIFCNILEKTGRENKEKAANYFYNAAKGYALEKNTVIFGELIKILETGDLEAKENALLLIAWATVNIKKNNLQKFLSDLETAGIKEVLEKNVDVKTNKFQKALEMYQKATNDIVNGSKYQIDIYKKKIAKMELYCAELEKKVEYVVQDQQFKDEIVTEFVYFKKLAETCAEVAGYFDPYTPTERYDKNFHKTVTVDKAGVVDIKKV